MVLWYLGYEYNTIQYNNKNISRTVVEVYSSYPT